jgi:hypothetical protein
MCIRERVLGRTSPKYLNRIDQICCSRTTPKGVGKVSVFLFGLIKIVPLNVEPVTTARPATASDLRGS